MDNRLPRHEALTGEQRTVAPHPDAHSRAQDVLARWAFDWKRASLAQIWRPLLRKSVSFSWSTLLNEDWVI